MTFQSHLDASLKVFTTFTFTVTNFPHKCHIANMTSHRFCGSCTGCIHQFRERKQLVIHLVCHTLEKNFSCTCGNSYKTKISLRMYMHRCKNVCTTHKILRIITPTTLFFVFERGIDKHSIELLYMSIMKDHLWIFKQILALYYCRLLSNYVTEVVKPTKIAKT